MQVSTRNCLLVVQGDKDLFCVLGYDTTFTACGSEGSMFLQNIGTHIPEYMIP
jgi:hypothetical protein